MYIPVILSVAALILSTVFAVIFYKSKEKSNKIKPIYILLSGAFIACFFIMLYVDYKPTVHGTGATLFLAIFHSIQVMLLGYDFESLYEAISMTTRYSSLTYFYLSMLFFVTPIYTFGFVLSFFESVTSYIRYLFKWRLDIYVLSDLSEKSAVLASSIRQKFPKSIIVFTNAASESGENAFVPAETRALYLKKDFTDVGLMFHSRRSKATFFAINSDESANLSAALSIIDKFRCRKNTEVYVFSTSKEGELLLDTAESGEVKVRRINEDRSLAYSIINNLPITEHFTQADDRKVISTLVIGFGGYGKELTKAMLWCGQLPDYELELNVIDADNDAESKFTFECPEIMQLNRNHEFGEAKYNITFHNGVDVHTHTFSEIISGLSDISVVYISLGNDELNIETAINTRILFERMGLYPVIRAIVYSDIKCKTLKTHNLKNHRGDSYDIEIIGDIKTRFSYDTIVNDELEALALNCHFRWANSPDELEKAIRQFNKYEYYRNSSSATAIHEKYREKAQLPEDIASIAEHMRWNAYMRTEGFVFSGSVDKSSRNDRAKMHHNLHRFGLLSDEDVDKDRRIASKQHQ